MDQYPYREDTERAISESIQWLKAFRTIINRAGMDMITDVIRRGDATEASRMLREAMFGGEKGRSAEYAKLILPDLIGSLRVRDETLIPPATSWSGGAREACCQCATRVIKSE